MRPSTHMLLKLLKIIWSAFRYGQVDGHTVTRNPIAWIPFFLGLPVIFVFGLLFIVGYIMLIPLIIIWGYMQSRSFERKSGVFSEQGIHFPKAYGQLIIAWS